MFPSSPCSSTVVLLKASYVVKAGAGISEQAYFLTDDQPLYGEGRGTKWATVEWVISTLSMALMPKKADGIQFQDPHLTVLVKRIMCRFVDGTTIWQNLLLQQSTEYETVRLQPGTLTAKDLCTKEVIPTNTAAPYSFGNDANRNILRILLQDP
jgi:hypothetical protein